MYAYRQDYDVNLRFEKPLSLGEAPRLSASSRWNVVCFHSRSVLMTIERPQRTRCYLPFLDGRKFLSIQYRS